MIVSSSWKARPTTHLLVVRLWWLWAVYSTAILGAPSYCAYAVNVRTPSGTTLPNVPVGMIERGTQIHTEITDASGSARFCDAPLHPVDLVVGTLDCAVVLVKGVKPTWPETREIDVIYDTGHCGELSFPTSCLVLLRVHNEQGVPVAGAELGSGEVSDASGRIFRLIKQGESLTGTLTKEGYEKAHISAPCIRGDERNVEKKIVLLKRAK
jgi:hypothetical protein